MAKTLSAFLSGLAMWLFLCLGLSTASEAKDFERTYRVVKGDYLEKVAKAHGTTWPVLAQLNRLKDPEHIEPGQVLKLPSMNTKFALHENPKNETTAAEVSCGTLTSTETFSWKNFGADPFRDRSFSSALDALCFPKHIRELFLKKVASGKFDDTIGILPGDEFAAMTFGRETVHRNVVASWKDQVIPARVYIITEGTTEYRLVYPLPCGNWAKQVRQLTPATVPALPELAKQTKQQPMQPEIPIIWGGRCDCADRDTSWWKPPPEPHPDIYRGS